MRKILFVINLFFVLALGSTTLGWGPQPGSNIEVAENGILNKPVPDLRLIIVKEAELRHLKTNGVVVRLYAKGSVPRAEYKNTASGIKDLKEILVSYLATQEGMQIRLIKADQIVQSPISEKWPSPNGGEWADKWKEWVDRLPVIDNGDIFLICPPPKKVRHY